MPDDMKTAFERAWERAEKIESSPRAQSELEYRPQGSRLAAAFSALVVMAAAISTKG